MTNRSIGKKRRGSSAIDISGVLFNFLLPAVLIAVMVGATGYLGYAGYGAAKSSDFFRIGSIEVAGIKRIPRGDVEAVVRRYSPDGGTWNADLDGLQKALADRSEVKTVAVSRQLPDVLRINIVERDPVAVVRNGNQLVWADGEGVIIGIVREDEQRPGLVMTGWDYSGSEVSAKENLERVKLYTKALEEWGDLSMVERVRELDTADIADSKAVIDEDGPVEVRLGKTDFGKRLKTAIEAVAGNGGQIRSVSFTADGQVVTSGGRQKVEDTGGKK